MNAILDREAEESVVAASMVDEEACRTCVDLLSPDEATTVIVLAHAHLFSQEMLTRLFTWADLRYNNYVHANWFRPGHTHVVSSQSRLRGQFA